MDLVDERLPAAVVVFCGVTVAVVAVGRLAPVSH
jgi:hypothetical protein